MIVSANPSPNLDEFTSLLNSSLEELNILAHKSHKEISLLAGNRLEPFIKDVIAEKAKGTLFENSIELISGQKFPDIIAQKLYGIEVKSTTQNHWKTTGNSVLESTRVDSVERIFMLFGKLVSPIEFKCRPYEECLSEVVVTHSPRYLIDMNLQIGDTIFDKINLSYDHLRTQINPIKPIVDYYRTKLKPGQDLWWMDQGNVTATSNMIIKPWSTLSQSEKSLLKIKAMAFFPEIFSNRNDKFNRFGIWLATQEAVICPNVRDLFTSGGKISITIGRETYQKLPKIFKTLFDNLPLIQNTIEDSTSEYLSTQWNRNVTDNAKFDIWLEILSKELKTITHTNNLNIRKMVLDFLIT
jgi:hypothetical protein